MKSNKFRQLRKASGLTLEDVAAAIGVSKMAVSKWETGDSLPAAGKLVQLAKLYRTTVDELLEGNDDD